MSEWVNPYNLLENSSSGDYQLLKCWFDSDEKFHRDDGPAAIHPNGDCVYYRHGLLHRLDGPALCSGKGSVKMYYIHGEQYGENEYWEHPSVIEYSKFVESQLSPEAKKAFKSSYDISMPTFIDISPPFVPPPADKSCLKSKSWAENQVEDIMESVDRDNQSKEDKRYGGLEI